MPTPAKPSPPSLVWASRNCPAFQPNKARLRRVFEQLKLIQAVSAHPTDRWLFPARASSPHACRKPVPLSSLHQHRCRSSRPASRLVDPPTAASGARRGFVRHACEPLHKSVWLVGSSAMAQGGQVKMLLLDRCDGLGGRRTFDLSPGRAEQRSPRLQEFRVIPHAENRRARLGVHRQV